MPVGPTALPAVTLEWPTVDVVTTLPEALTVVVVGIVDVVTVGGVVVGSVEPSTASVVLVVGSVEPSFARVVVVVDALVVVGATVVVVDTTVVVGATVVVDAIVVVESVEPCVTSVVVVDAVVVEARVELVVVTHPAGAGNALLSVNSMWPFGR